MKTKDKGRVARWRRGWPFYMSPVDVRRNTPERLGARAVARVKVGRHKHQQMKSYELAVTLAEKRSQQS